MLLAHQRDEDWEEIAGLVEEWWRVFGPPFSGLFQLQSGPSSTITISNHRNERIFCLHLLVHFLHSQSLLQLLFPSRKMDYH